MNEYLERVVDLTDPDINFIYNMSVDEARRRVLHGTPEDVRQIDGSFCLLANEGKRVRLARSLDRPMRYFLAKRVEGPALIVANRIDKIHQWLVAEGFGGQFHPSYTRMVPAHHVVELKLIGCPDPDPIYTRFFAPERNKLGRDFNEIGQLYITALADEIGKWLKSVPAHEPIGVCFSGGIDSGTVFVVTYHMLLKLGMNPSRLKAFTLNLGDGKDVDQARQFLSTLGLEYFLEVIDANPAELDMAETIRVVEDYKTLDVEAAAMGMLLCKGIRRRYPDWKLLMDGDGGDENLKDYPIEENPELTIRSVIHNRMLYHEGWGLGTMKHSLTYSGGLSRSYARTFATGRKFGFDGFSPFTRPQVIEVSEGIPYIDITGYDVQKLYDLKGEVARLGVKAVTGLDMPAFPKRRFQHGAIDAISLRKHLPANEAEYRKKFLEIYL